MVYRPSLKLYMQLNNAVCIVCHMRRQSQRVTKSLVHENVEPVVMHDVLRNVFKTPSLSLVMPIIYRPTHREIIIILNVMTIRWTRRLTGVPQKGQTSSTLWFSDVYFA